LAKFNQVTLFPYWDSKRWLVDDYYQSLLPLLPYKSTLIEYTIEQRIESTIEQFIGFIESLSACQTFRKQEGGKEYQDLLEDLRQKLIECYKKKLIIEIMKKNQQILIQLNLQYQIQFDFI